MKQQETNSDFLAVHEDVVKRVLDKQPAEEELYDLAELFKVFGDSTTSVSCMLYWKLNCV